MIINTKEYISLISKIILLFNNRIVRNIQAKRLLKETDKAQIHFNNKYLLTCSLIAKRYSERLDYILTHDFEYVHLDENENILEEEDLVPMTKNEINFYNMWFKNEENPK